MKERNGEVGEGARRREQMELIRSIYLISRKSAFDWERSCVGLASYLFE